VLLLFQRGASLDTTHLSGGTIQPYDGHGPSHMAFAIAAEHLFVWEACQRRNDIDIEGLADWPRGGGSVKKLGRQRAVGKTLPFTDARGLRDGMADQAGRQDRVG
jgi:hypothetical protein